MTGVGRFFPNNHGRRSLRACMRACMHSTDRRLDGLLDCLEKKTSIQANDLGQVQQFGIRQIPHAFLHPLSRLLQPMK